MCLTVSLVTLSNFCFSTSCDMHCDVFRDIIQWGDRVLSIKNAKDPFVAYKSNTNFEEEIETGAESAFGGRLIWQEFKRTNVEK